MQISSWTVEEKLQGALNLLTQEEQICHILSTLEEVFYSERLSIGSARLGMWGKAWRSWKMVNFNRYRIFATISGHCLLFREL